MEYFDLLNGTRLAGIKTPEGGYKILFTNDYEKSLLKVFNKNVKSVFVPTGDFSYNYGHVEELSSPGEDIKYTIGINGDITAMFDEELLEFFSRWLNWQRGLGNKEYKELFGFPRGEYFSHDLLESFAKHYPHLITAHNTVIVNIGEIRSHLVFRTGTNLQNELKNTIRFIENKLKHPLAILSENTPVITVDDSAEVYVFCEYQGDSCKPWTQCLLAKINNDLVTYHTRARSEIKPLSSVMLEDINGLGQAVLARRYPELK